MISSHLYIDIHTHQKPSSNAIAFQMGRHAQGIHPWDLVPELTLEDLKAQFEVIKAKSMLAVGECGLDRRKKNIKSMEEQLVVFRWHIDLAQRLKIPVIVHCVHAESDLLSILKSCHFKGTLLLHDFVGNYKSLEQFKNYNVYYSFGARLFWIIKGFSSFLNKFQSINCFWKLMIKLSMELKRSILKPATYLELMKLG